MVILTKKPKKRKRARVYVRAWRIHRNPRGGARDVVLSITAPSGGTPQGEPGASVSEHSARKAEERCRTMSLAVGSVLRFSRRPFYIVKVCRGQELWRSHPIYSRDVALGAMAARKQIYTARRYEVQGIDTNFRVNGNGTSFDIYITRRSG